MTDFNPANSLVWFYTIHSMFEFLECFRTKHTFAPFIVVWFLIPDLSNMSTTIIHFKLIHNALIEILLVLKKYFSIIDILDMVNLLDNICEMLNFNWSQVLSVDLNEWLNDWLYLVI